MSRKHGAFGGYFTPRTRHDGRGRTQRELLDEAGFDTEPKDRSADEQASARSRAKKRRGS